MQTRDRIAQSSVPATLRVIGDGWTLSLLTALVGAPRRFEALMEVLGIPRSTLAARLRHLTSYGLVVAHPYSARPLRVEYGLSATGMALLPVLTLADAFDVTHGGQRAALQHAPSVGAPHALRAVACCAACGERVEARHVDASYGAGSPAGSTSEPGPKGKRATRSRSARKPLLRARDVLEDAWAAKVVAALFMGEQRFTDIVDATQAAPNIVSERLQRLAEARLLRHVTRTEQSEGDLRLGDGGPPAPVYQLTARGVALYPLVVALIAYGDAQPGRAPSLALRHRCAAPLVLRLSCAGCADAAGGVPLLPCSVSFAMQADLCATPTPT